MGKKGDWIYPDKSESMRERIQRAVDRIWEDGLDGYGGGLLWWTATHMLGQTRHQLRTDPTGTTWLIVAIPELEQEPFVPNEDGKGIRKCTKEEAMEYLGASDLSPEEGAS